MYSDEKLTDKGEAVKNNITSKIDLCGTPQMTISCPKRKRKKWFSVLKLFLDNSRLFFFWTEVFYHDLHTAFVRPVNTPTV